MSHPTFTGELSRLVDEATALADDIDSGPARYPSLEHDVAGLRDKARLARLLMDRARQSHDLYWEMERVRAKMEGEPKALLEVFEAPTSFFRAVILDNAMRPGRWRRLRACNHGVVSAIRRGRSRFKNKG